MNVLKGHIASLANGQNRHLGRATLSKTLFEMQRIASENTYQVVGLANELEGASQGASRFKTLENIWQWVRANIAYQHDEKGKEELRSPARTIKDAKGDCDCTSILISALLLNLKIPHFFRVVAIATEEFEHVYVVALLENNQDIILDTVPEIPYFNFEHPYKKKKDFKIMKHYDVLSGLALNEYQVIKGYLKEMFNSLNQFHESDLIKKEKALVKLVNTYLEDEANQEQSIRHAIEKSTEFQDVYKELLFIITESKKEESLNALPVLAVAAGTLLKSKTGQSVVTSLGKKVSTGISTLFKNGGASIETKVQPGDIYTDAAGNTVQVTSDYQQYAGYKTLINQSQGGAVSELVLGTDGKLYGRNEGGKEGHSKGAVYFVVNPSSNWGIQDMGRLKDWPTAAKNALSNAQMQSIQAPVVTIPGATAQITQTVSQEATPIVQEELSRSLSVSANTSQAATNQKWMMIAGVALVMIATGATIFLSKK